MSGLEIAGLALGAFPLMLHLLEDYRKGAEVLSDWWRIRRAYEEWKHDLAYHQTAFQLSSKLILMPLMVDDELEQFLNDPTGQIWRDKMWEARLKERLSDSYDAVLRLVSGINDIMLTIEKQLGVNNTDLQTKMDEQGNRVQGRDAFRRPFSIDNINFQKARFRLAILDGESRKRLFAQLKESNDRLRDLISANDQVAAARRDRDSRQSRPALNKKLQDYWRHAKALYEALSKATGIGSGGTTCRCAGHVVNLQLIAKDPTKTEFGVLFSGLDLNGGFSWNKTRIEMVSNINSVREPILVGAGTTARRVGFADSNRDPDSSQPPENAEPIQCLCMEMSSPPRACVGFIDQDEQRFVVYPETHMLRNPGTSITTLDSILHTTDTLTRRQRYVLAHTIATWFLRLGSTPWISLPIQANIVFLQATTAPAVDNIDMERMYIGGELGAYAPTATVDAIRNLGICLLELCFGYSLESYKNRNGFSGGTAALASLLDHAAAVKWCEDVQEEAGPDFADAIDWCLRPRNQHDESWRKDIWANVIIPLDNCSNHVSRRVAV